MLLTDCFVLTFVCSYVPGSNVVESARPTRGGQKFLSLDVLD